MKITSLTIGGTEMVNTQGPLQSPYYAVMFTGFKIYQAISSKTGTATFSIKGKASVLGAILLPRAAVVITGTSSTTLFKGEITRIDPKVVNLSPGYTEYVISCRDYGFMLDEAIITTRETLANGSNDWQGIGYLFTNYLSAIDSSFGSSNGVSAVSTLPDMVFERVTLRAAMDNICNVTGGGYYVDYNKKLQYFSPTGRAASFGVSDTPNNSTTFYALMRNFQFATEGNALFNRIIVIGALDAGAGVGNGVPFVSTKNDTTSQGVYGIHVRTIVDTSLTTQAAVDARANAELATNKNPQHNGVFVITKSGLGVGQLITVVSSPLNVNGSYLIREITSEWTDQSTVNYTVGFGEYTPDVNRWLRELAVIATPPTVRPIAVSPPASIVPSQVDHISATSITTGTLDASVVNVTNLNASNITTGTLDASVVNVTNINASHITTGTLNAITITASTLTCTDHGITTTVRNDSEPLFGGRGIVITDGTNFSALTPNYIVSLVNGGGVPGFTLERNNSGLGGPLLSLAVNGVTLQALATTTAATINWTGNHFALWIGADQKQVVAGDSTFSSGSKAISSGLSSIDSAVAISRSGGLPTEFIGVGISGGTATFYSSNATSTAAFDYEIVGSI